MSAVTLKQVGKSYGPVQVIEGLDLEGACRLGAATAALVATGLGSDAGVRDRAQVEASMAKG